MVFRDENITSITVDEDHSILYIASYSGISILEYAPEIEELEDVMFGINKQLIPKNA